MNDSFITSCGIQNTFPTLKPYMMAWQYMDNIDIMAWQYIGNMAWQYIDSMAWQYIDIIDII